MIKRYWINQPSTLQPDHKLNGKNVLADLTTFTLAKANGQKYGYIYFTEGDIVSQRISFLSLSPGWRSIKSK